MKRTRKRLIILALIIALLGMFLPRIFNPPEIVLMEIKGQR